MKTIQNILFVCISLFSLTYASAFEYNFKPENIHVLLEKDVTEAFLEVCGPYYIFNPYDGSKISSGILGKRFIVRPTSLGLKWGQEFPGIHQMIVIPRSSDTSILLNGIQYKGAIGIYKVNEYINLINQIDVESYLKSILSTQFPYPLESEAMAALAIAARTTSYYQIYKNNDSFWHVDGKIIGYQGSALVIPDSSTSHAIDATKNLILLNQKDEHNTPFIATWTEHCGGKTASLQTVFRKDLDAPPEGVEAPIAALDRKDSRWSYSISTENLASLLDMKKISSIDLFQDSTSNKVYAIRIKYGDNTKDIDFFTFQKMVGKKFLKSNDFSVFMRDDEIHFIGYGKGHGVGLCLYSASAMAQNGDMAIKILSKFFPNTFIMNLSAGLSQDKTVKK